MAESEEESEAPIEIAVTRSILEIAERFGIDLPNRGLLEEE
jgi:hypothetical protein